MPRCIYCGVDIPPDVGLRCPKCNTQTSTKDFDKEFSYADEIEPQVAKILEETEVRSVNESSQKAREEFYRLYEQNVASRKQYRWANQEELQKRREGKILHMNEFMRLLRNALGSERTAWYTEKGGMANTLGLYVGHTGLLPACSHKNGEPHYVGFVQVPFMQEFEELHFDRYNVPLGSKRRGWRTIGLKLIEQGLVSEQRFHEVFGAPASNEMSRRYREYLHYTRNKAV